MFLFWATDVALKSFMPNFSQHHVRRKGYSRTYTVFLNAPWEKFQNFELILAACRARWRYLLRIPKLDMSTLNTFWPSRFYFSLVEQILRRLACWKYSKNPSINCLSQGPPLRKVSVSKNVTSEIREKAPKAYPFFLKSVMCSFWKMAFASTCRFSLVTKSNSSSATTLRWNFPQTFCVLNQQPFLLFVKILCALSIDSYSTSSKPVQSIPSLPSHLQRTYGNTSRIRARKTWELYVRTQLTKLNEFLGSSRSWRPNKTKSKENSLFPPTAKGMMLSAQTMYTYRFARKTPSFEVLVF